MKENNNNNREDCDDEVLKFNVGKEGLNINGARKSDEQQEIEEYRQMKQIEELLWSGNKWFPTLKKRNIPSQLLDIEKARTVIENLRLLDEYMSNVEKRASEKDKEIEKLLHLKKRRQLFFNAFSENIRRRCVEMHHMRMFTVLYDNEFFHKVFETFKEEIEQTLTTTEAEISHTFAQEKRWKNYNNLAKKEESLPLSIL